MKCSIGLLSKVLILISTTNAPAAILFSNFGERETFALSATAPGPIWATDFHTGPQSAVVTSITVQVSLSLAVGQSFGVRIAADDGTGDPGPVIGGFDSVIVVPGQGSGYYTASDAGIALSPNRRYWALLEVTAGVGGGSALSCTSSEDIDEASLYALVNSTGISVSFDGVSYLPVQAGNLRFALAGTVLDEGAALLSILSGPGPGGFGLRVNGKSGRLYRLQASSTPSGGWQDVRSFTLTGTSTNIVDTTATNFTRRFYRVVGD